MERAVAARKAWGVVHQLPPSSYFVDAYEAGLFFVDDLEDVQSNGPLLLRAHEEIKGTIIIRLTQGDLLLRRAHIGGIHQEPDDGPVFYGPHVHFPTTVFGSIEGRRARSRIYGWDVPESIPLWDAVMAFADEINLVGYPTVQQRRLPEGGP